MSSIRRPLPTDDSDVDFQPVINKKSQRKQRKSKETHVSQGTPIDHVSAIELDQNRAFEGRGVGDDGVNRQIGLSSQPIPISNESKRYAQTRYPFSPFILRFNSGKILVNQVKECLIDHCKKIHETDIQIIHCRSFKSTGSDNGDGNNFSDFLIYLKDAVSFSFMLEQAHWPNSIGNEGFSFPSTPAIPPQLCLLIKNVDLHIDFNEFCDDIKNKYPQVKNIIRMKNKFQNDIKLIKLEFTSPAVRDKLLNEKRIIVNYITNDTVEYLVPATVLICSKCMAIGHFKKQCSQIKETCRTCGELVDDKLF
jgi:hypothetical protein